jgi:hypothetical protein
MRFYINTPHFTASTRVFDPKMTPETTLLTDIGGKPKAAVVRLGSDATRKTAGTS